MPKKRQRELGNISNLGDKTVENPSMSPYEGMTNEELLSGSGATGGAETGEETPGGQTVDLTHGALPGGGHFGGPTGGDINGAGKGGWTPPEEAPAEAAAAGDIFGPGEIRVRDNTGVGQRIAAQNVRIQLNPEG
jgi:hypothetical protein